MKSAALIFAGAFGPDFAAVEFDKLFGERQAQTGALIFALEGTVHLFEGVEDGLQILRTNADASWVHFLSISVSFEET